MYRQSGVPGRLLWGLGLVLLSVTISATAREAEVNDSSNGASEALHKLFAREWDHQMEHNPTWASTLGDRRWNGGWEDVSLEAIRKDHEHDVATLDALRKIDRRQLSSRDQLNYDLFEWEYQVSIEGYSYHWYLVPLNQRGGIQTADELADSLRFQTVQDYEDWTQRLRALPAYLDQTTALMREGIREGIVLPKVIMQRIPAQIDKQIVGDPAASPFYKPFAKFPDGISQADQARLSAAAVAAIQVASFPPTGGSESSSSANTYPPATTRSASGNCPTAKPCTLTSSASTRRPT